MKTEVIVRRQSKPKPVQAESEPVRNSGLVLTRGLGEKIMIEHGLVTIEVVQIRKNQVRLRFIGNVRIDREEVHLQEINKQKKDMP